MDGRYMAEIIMGRMVCRDETVGVGSPLPAPKLRNFEAVLRGGRGGFRIIIALALLPTNPP